MTATGATAEHAADIVHAAGGADASPPPRSLLALLALAAVWHAAAFAAYMPNNDFIRDILFALPIVDGGPLPLRGPPINDAGHLGPLWFHVVALPLSLGTGLTGVALWLGALSTLKVPLAWRLGTRLGGRWLGLGFAAALLLPGWDGMHAIQTTHTVLFETMLLAGWLPLLTLWRGGAPWRWALFGALGGLAVHGHPLAVCLLLPAAVVAVRRRARLRDDAGWIVLGIALALVPLLPMLVAEAREGWPMLGMAQAKLDEVPAYARTPLHELVVAFVAGPWTVPALLSAPPWDAIARIGAAVAFGVALGGVPALSRDPARRRIAMIAAGLLAVAFVVLVVVRYRTPFYMALLATPAMAILLALPVAALGARERRGRWAAMLAVLAMLVAGAASSIGWVAGTRDGHVVVPVRAISDIRHTDGDGVRIGMMPMYALDSVAAARCGSPALIVHGELAPVIDYYQRVPFRAACPPMPVRLMGRDPAASHWAGMTPHALRRLGYTDASWDDAVALAPRRVIAPAVGVDIPVRYRYPARDIAPGPAQPRRIAFTGAADEAVAAYSALFPYDAASPPVAHCDGVPVAPVLETNAGALFVPPRAGAGCAWEITLESRVPDQVDVFTLPLPPR